MRIGIQGWGSEGDLRPLVALAIGLRRAGHTVRLDLTPVDGTDYADLCRTAEIPLRVIPGRLDFALHTVATDGNALDPLKVSRDLVERAFFPFLEQLYQAALELCATSDVVLWHYSCWHTKAAALKTGTPEGAVHFFPGLVPSRVLPPAGLPSFGPLNPALWWLARAMLDLQFRKRPAQFFAARGLPPVRHVLVIPKEDEPWQPSRMLSGFLERGDPPVLLSLGSMEHLAPQRARDLLIAAARAAGVRAIIQSKRSSADGEDGDLFFLPRAPHAALLRHCSAMVHHGGAGTVHTSVGAGVPSLAVPFILEQKVWGDLLHKMGAGGAPVPFWKAKPEQLARRIRELVTSAPLAARAHALAGAVAAEDGVSTARALVEAIPTKRQAPTPRPAP